MKRLNYLGVEPVGYWPRWAFVLGLIAYAPPELVIRPVKPRFRARSLIFA